MIKVFLLYTLNFMNSNNILAFFYLRFMGNVIVHTTLKVLIVKNVWTFITIIHGDQPEIESQMHVKVSILYSVHFSMS